MPQESTQYQRHRKMVQDAKKDGDVLGGQPVPRTPGGDTQWKEEA